MRSIGVGEILWDLIGDREYLGGAVLNCSIQAARLGHDVALISAVGNDPRGRRALECARQLGLSVDFVRVVEEHETGTVTVTVDGGGQPSYVIHRPAAYDFATLDETDFARLASPPPDWICFGTLHSMYPAARTLLEEVIGRFPAARKFYDVNLRKDSFTPALVERLLGLADVVKLNDGEVDAVQQMLGTSEPSLEAFCQRFGARLGWQAACVTRGDCGCAVWIAGAYHELPGYSVKVADTVGAGDAFAAAFVHGLDAGWSPREVGDFANRLGALVASRPGGVPAWTLDEVKQLA